MLPPLDQNRVPWRRYWMKHDGGMNLGDTGYLIPPPQNRRSLDPQPDASTYEEVASKRFLALMGEMGAGKTDTILAIAHALKDAGHAVEYIALDLVDGSATLKQRLERTKALAQAGNEVTLFLDQYEVSGLGAQTYGYLVAELLDGYQLGHIKIRLGCRSGTWNAELERVFCRLCEAEQMGVLELGYLTRADVVAALTRVHTNPEELLVGFERRDLVPLLTRPVTLRLITNLVEKGEDVTSLSTAEAYRRGLTAMVRSPSAAEAAPEERERIAVALRIAAASVFCDKQRISTGPDDGADPPNVIHTKDLTGGTEPQSDGDAVPVKDKAVRDLVTQTGLFTLRGTGAFGWSHQSYAEYCAAEYVRVHHMSVDQTKSLLRLRADGSPIVPALQGVVSWLLTNGALPLDDEFISRWPTIVLRSDVQNLQDGQRAALVRALLDDAERGTLDIFSPIVRLRLSRLAHVGLATQLRAWFTDKAKSPRSRGLAMRIATACKVEQLASEIAGVALDATEPLDVRDTAAYQIAGFDDPAARLALRPFIDPGDDADANDQLRGAAFRALWPQYLSTPELFQFLTEPRNDRYLGSYGMFLYDLPKKLNPEDLEPALRWAASRPARNDIGRVQRVVDSMLAVAFRHLDIPGVLSLVGDILIARARGYVPLFERERDEPSPLDTPSRRRLIEHLASRLDGAEVSNVVVSARPPLLEPQDVPWLLSRHQDGAPGAWPELLSDLVLYRRDAVAEHQDRLTAEAERDPAIRAALRWLLGPIVLQSAEADTARKHYKQQQEWEAERPDDEDAPKRQLILESVLNGTTTDFIQLPFALGVDDGWGLDLVESSGWKLLTEEQRAKIKSVARAYVESQDDNRGEWLGKNSYPWKAVAGYRALRLLRQDAGALDALPKANADRIAGKGSKLIEKTCGERASC